MPSLREHKTNIRVRYTDTDPMGFLHHSAYLTYFEIGRTELLRASGGNYREMEETGNFVVVVEAQVRYRRPASYDDLLTVKTIVSRVTPARIEHKYELLRDNELLATATVTLAMINDQGQLQRIPESLQTD
jgi:acyl-CoA thioester hydrolase